MKVIKFFFGILAGILAGFWCFGILLKFVRFYSFYAASPLFVSHLLGVVAGVILTGLLSYSCFRSALKPGEQKNERELNSIPAAPIADPNSSSRRD